MSYKIQYIYYYSQFTVIGFISIILILKIRNVGGQSTVDAEAVNDQQSTWR